MKLIVFGALLLCGRIFVAISVNVAQILYLLDRPLGIMNLGLNKELLIDRIQYLALDSNIEIPDDDVLNIDDRILNGQLAAAQAFPYLVSLQEYQGGSYSKFCGGVILTRIWILTAAHCFDEVSPSAPTRFSKNYYINAGSVDAYNRAGPSQFIKVKSIHKHFQFDDMVKANDICLLQLEKPLEFNKYVKAISVPYRGFEPRGSGTIVGWGAIDHEEKESPSELRFARIPVSSRSICTAIFDIPQNAICLGGGIATVNACGGDSGGPFIQKLKGRLVVSGLASFGKIGCYENEPVVYTNVAKYLDWIFNITQRNSAKRKFGSQVSKKRIEHPYTVAIMDYNDEAREFSKLCAGIILDELWVLTSADCFDNIGLSSKNRLRVKIGSPDLSSPASNELLQIESFYKHKDYNARDPEVKNDIALVKLKNRLNFDKQNVKQAFLPPNYFDIDNFDGSILGWKDRYDPKNIDDVTQEFLSANVTTADEKECKKLYPKISDVHLCVKRTGAECNDDLGAPLVVTKGYNHFVVGLKSVVDKNCDNNKPFLVTNVLEYLDVINDIMSTH